MMSPKHLSGQLLPTSASLEGRNSGQLPAVRQLEPAMLPLALSNWNAQSSGFEESRPWTQICAKLLHAWQQMMMPVQMMSRSSERLLSAQQLESAWQPLTLVEDAEPSSGMQAQQWLMNLAQLKAQSSEQLQQLLQPQLFGQQVQKLVRVEARSSGKLSSERQQPMQLAPSEAQRFDQHRWAQHLPTPKAQSWLSKSVGTAHSCHSTLVPHAEQCSCLAARSLAGSCENQDGRVWRQPSPAVVCSLR
mmetsp:Transcript_12908/g.35039  ORF Transcript_12908/g.35039 Transcript_12908/m.35039 type:complete len:247 (-) Transcript_12908:717-1457(-)